MRLPQPGSGTSTQTFRPLLLDVAIQIEVAHARLDQRVGVLLVHLEDAVHPLEVEHHAAGVGRRGAAVAQIRPVEIG